MVPGRLNASGRYGVPMGSGWPEYVAAFHAGRAGITEQVLRRARLDGRDAYDWLADAVPPAGLVLDVACGSAPMRDRLPGRAYMGVDLSAAELAVARQGGADRLARRLGEGSVPTMFVGLTGQPLEKAEAIVGAQPYGGRIEAAIERARSLR